MIPSSQARGTRGPRHARPRRIRGVDARTEDLLRDQAKAVYRGTGLDSIALGDALGVEESTARHKRAEGTGVAFDALLFTYNLARTQGAFASTLIARCRSVHAQALMPISDADLVDRFWTLTAIECTHEGEENNACAQFGRTGDLTGFGEALLKEAATQEELAAVCRELARRKIDPRTYNEVSR